MKRTKKSVTQQTESTEILCEIAQDEFDQICAETAASTIVRIMGENPDANDLMMGVTLTSILAKFVSDLAVRLFTDNDNNENPDKKEEK